MVTELAHLEEQVALVLVVEEAKKEKEVETEKELLEEKPVVLFALFPAIE